jgi:hypothetical protein
VVTAPHPKSPSVENLSGGEAQLYKVDLQFR